MRLSVGSKAILARAILVLFFGFGIWNRQLTPEQIETGLHSVPYRCPLRLITGWKCAFCGMTHAWIAIFRGEWAHSFQENIFGIPLFLATTLLLLLFSLNRKIKINLKPFFLGSVAVLSVYAVLRNIL